MMLHCGSKVGLLVTEKIHVAGIRPSQTGISEICFVAKSVLQSGANIGGRGTCGMFQSVQLTYRDVLRSGPFRRDGDEDGDGDGDGDGDKDEDEDEDGDGDGDKDGDEDEDGDEDGDLMYSRDLMYSGDLLYSGDLMYSGDLNIGNI